MIFGMFWGRDLGNLDIDRYELHPIAFLYTSFGCYSTSYLFVFPNSWSVLGLELELASGMSCVLQFVMVVVDRRGRFVDLAFFLSSSPQHPHCSPFRIFVRMRS